MFTVCLPTSGSLTYIILPKQAPGFLQVTLDTIKLLIAINHLGDGCLRPTVSSCILSLT